MVVPKGNLEVEAYKKELHETTIEPLEVKIAKNRDDYNISKITAEEYVSRNDVLLNEIKKQIVLNKDAVKTSLDNNRYFGWKTKRKFFYGFGLRLTVAVMALIISVLISMIPKEVKKEKYLKFSLLLLQFSCYFISTYIVVWCFWTSQDYPIETYKWAFIAFAIINSMVVVYYVSFKNIFRSKLQAKISSLLGYVFEIRNKHYPKVAMRSMEVDEKETISDINEFEEKYIQELEKIAK